MIHRILVATDRSDTATRAVAWAAEMSGRYEAELLVLQVIAPEHMTGETAEDQLAALTQEVCGSRGRPLLVYGSDPAAAIVRACAQAQVDLVVVGNVGMRDRTEFLLGSVPNRVSRNARYSVVIVNTAAGGVPQAEEAPRDAAPTEGQLLGRAAHVARVLAKCGLGDVRDRSGDALGRARRFRAALEELEPTFGKLGQILSTRPDLGSCHPSVSPLILPTSECARSERMFEDGGSPVVALRIRPTGGSAGLMYPPSPSPAVALITLDGANGGAR